MAVQKSLLTYQSVKFIKVHNTKLALLHYITQVVILIYVIVFSIVLSKGYQEYDSAVGTTTVKTKGVGSLGTFGQPDFEVLDFLDLVVPAIEEGSFFTATNIVRTVQSPGICAGFDSTELCIGPEGEDNCVAGRVTEHGYTTGTCLGEYCEINAWCPVEDDSDPNQELVNGVDEFTVSAKVSIEFPQFEIALGNMEERLIPENVSGQNLFTVREMVERTGYAYEDVQSRGAIILASVDYNCDLNDGTDNCRSDTTFSRLDKPDAFSPGFNYRYVTKNSDGTERLLTKAYGIRIIFDIWGDAGRFNIVPLLTNIGAGMALLSVATLVCDIVLQYLMPNKEKYTQEKFEDIRDMEEEALIHSRYSRDSNTQVQQEHA